MSTTSLSAQTWAFVSVTAKTISWMTCWYLPTSSKVPRPSPEVEWEVWEFVDFHHGRHQWLCGYSSSQLPQQWGTPLGLTLVRLSFYSSSSDYTVGTNVSFVVPQQNNGACYSILVSISKKPPSDQRKWPECRLRVVGYMWPHFLLMPHTTGNFRIRSSSSWVDWWAQLYHVPRANFDVQGLECQGPGLQLVAVSHIFQPIWPTLQVVSLQESKPSCSSGQSVAEPLPLRPVHQAFSMLGLRLFWCAFVIPEIRNQSDFFLLAIQISSMLWNSPTPMY